MPRAARSSLVSHRRGDRARPGADWETRAPERAGGRRRNEAREGKGKGKGGRIVYRGSAKARSGHAEPEPEPAGRRCGAGLARRRSVGRSGGGEDKTLRKTRSRAHIAVHGRRAARSSACTSDIAAARQDGRSRSLDRLLGRQMTQHRLACAVREGEPGQPAYASASAPGKRHSMFDSASGATPGKVQAQAGTRAGRRLLQLYASAALGGNGEDKKARIIARAAFAGPGRPRERDGHAGSRPMVVLDRGKGIG